MSDFRAKIVPLRVWFLALVLIPAFTRGQSARMIREMFTQAQSHYLYGEYELANPIYLQIASFQPDNSNIQYKIGNCYLNIPDEKNKSIEFLEKAVKNASFDAKSDNVKEKKAPLDAYFLLGKAYMVNNELDKAISTFLTFQKLAAPYREAGGIDNAEFVDQQILAGNLALKLQETPLKIEKSKLPQDFSNGSVNENPAVSYDGNSIIYTEKRGLSNAIFYAKRERGLWQPPIEITSEINAGEDCSTCALNADGTEMFLYKQDNYDGNLYSSTLVEDKWTPVKRLNKNINTRFFESHASVSFDGKRLYFTSNREGGLGGLDIYVSERDNSGEWGIPVNLGPVINTRFNEETPFISRNDSILFFSSEGHSSIGGHDIFKSRRSGDEWLTPENIGYPVSTTDDDLFFEPFNNGLNAYYSLPTEYKKREIHYLGIGTAAIDQIFEITGLFKLDDSIQRPDQRFRIHLIDGVDGDTLQSSFPSRETGSYSFTVNPGNFKLSFSGPDYLTQIRDTVLRQDNPSQVIKFDVTLLKDPSIVYARINLNQIPTVSALDSSMLIRDLKVGDIGSEADTTVLYYTVQVMALHNPVDVSYFTHIPDLKVIYNDADKFYRYTTGTFSSREEAESWKAELIRKGYPRDLFVKKVSKQ